jgi:hypothetical protein
MRLKKSRTALRSFNPGTWAQARTKGRNANRKIGELKTILSESGRRGLQKRMFAVKPEF